MHRMENVKLKKKMHSEHHINITQRYDIILYSQILKRMEKDVCAYTTQHGRK